MVVAFKDSKTTQTHTKNFHRATIVLDARLRSRPPRLTREVTLSSVVFELRAKMFRGQPSDTESFHEPERGIGLGQYSDDTSVERFTADAISAATKSFRLIGETGMSERLRIVATKFFFTNKRGLILFHRVSPQRKSRRSIIIRTPRRLRSVVLLSSDQKRRCT